MHEQVILLGGRCGQNQKNLGLGASFSDNFDHLMTWAAAKKIGSRAFHINMATIFSLPPRQSISIRENHYEAEG
ncbi:hypothetical protein [Kiloniella sp. b19]|uniref:hypothetical protein n=1 Tax=Kiloniella sp. GXU_MW_B19 TaxID=3141326 RepID=UPI0031D389C7